MGKDNHDKLLDAAAALSVKSPWDTIHLLRLDLLDEVRRLQTATVHELAQHGVLTDRLQDERLHAEHGDEVLRIDGDSFVYSDEYLMLKDELGPSAEDVIGQILQGATTVVASSLSGVAPDLPRQLRNAAVQATRLQLLLTLNPQARGVRFLARLNKDEYTDRCDHGVPVWVDYADYVEAPMGYFVARHHVARTRDAADKWFADLHACDQNGRELAPRCRVVTVSAVGREVSKQMIADAITPLDTLSVAERITGFTTD